MPIVQASHPGPHGPRRTASRMHIAARRILRTGLGMLILATGVGKMLDIPGFAQVVGTYQFDLGPDARSAVAIAIATIELLIGIWMLSGWHLARSAIAATALNACYFVLMSSSLLRGLELENCGCFGVYLASPLRWYSPLEDAALVVLCLLLLRLARRRRCYARFMPLGNP